MRRNGLWMMRSGVRQSAVHSTTPKLRSAGRNCIQLVAFFVFLAGASQAQGDPFAALLTEIAQGPGAACRVAVAEQRIGEWRDGPETVPAFASVEEIMAPIEGATSTIVASGCAAEFVYSFRSCTQLDNPDAPHIVPRGVKAETDAEYAEILRGCFAALAAVGVRP